MLDPVCCTPGSANSPAEAHHARTTRQLVLREAPHDAGANVPVLTWGGYGSRFGGQRRERPRQPAASQI